MHPEQLAAAIRRTVLDRRDTARTSFLSIYEPRLGPFSEHVADVVFVFHAYDALARTSDRCATLAALLHLTASNLISSMDLFLSGHLTASGNLLRQVIECGCLAALCSCAELQVHEQWSQERYSVQKAPAHCLRESERLGLHPRIFEQLIKVQRRCDKVSHPTYMTLAHQLSFADVGKSVFGAAFDPGKVDVIYESEFVDREGVAMCMSGIANILYKRREDLAGG